MKKRQYISHDERLMIAQWIEEEKRTAINEQYKNDVLSVCAAVAMYKLCNHDIKIWNSWRGEQAYTKVLAVAMGHGLAHATWKE